MARRIDLTKSQHLTLGDAAAAHPEIDHFHVVEEMDGRQYVFHYSVWRDGESVEVVDENGREAGGTTIAGNLEVIGDEAHGR